jgi:hypothetical protein
MGFRLLFCDKSPRYLLVKPLEMTIIYDFHGYNSLTFPFNCRKIETSSVNISKERG